MRERQISRSERLSRRRLAHGQPAQAFWSAARSDFFICMVRYAFGRADMTAAFREDSGNRWEPGSTPVDPPIDEATGAGLEFIRAFARWHNERIWGEVNGKPVDAA